MTNPVRVDIWSDIACPWCYINRRRFETAVAEFVAGGGDVEYHAYELDPGVPVDLADDVSYVDHITSRKGWVGRRSARCSVR